MLDHGVLGVFQSVAGSQKPEAELRVFATGRLESLVEPSDLQECPPSEEAVRRHQVRDPALVHVRIQKAKPCRVHAHDAAPIVDDPATDSDYVLRR